MITNNSSKINNKTDHQTNFLSFGLTEKILPLDDNSSSTPRSPIIKPRITYNQQTEGY